MVHRSTRCTDEGAAPALITESPRTKLVPFRALHDELRNYPFPGMQSCNLNNRRVFVAAVAIDARLTGRTRTIDGVEARSLKRREA
jgi:hypothetical protein